jgi:hypothetical protein
VPGNDGAAISHRVTRDRIGTGDAVQVARGGVAVGHEGGPFAVRVIVPWFPAV